MREPVKRSLIQDYQAARARANRYMRDSSPALSKKGMAELLKLEQSAFNKFLNGTIFVDESGDALTASLLDRDPIFLRAKWTEKRLNRFIERVETKCWRLGIANRPNPNIQSEARSEAERLRVSKHYQFVCDVKDSAELSLSSALLFWEVGSQEAIDARDHLRPTMLVNALVALGDLVDRRVHGDLATRQLVGTEQQQRLEEMIDVVLKMIEAAHALTGSPCTEPVDSKSYECFHKAHGYGGYDLYFLGSALADNKAQQRGLVHLMQAVAAHHHPNDGHVANTATVLETALEWQHPMATDWAIAFADQIDDRLSRVADDPACHRLKTMKIPRLKAQLEHRLFCHPYFRVPSTVTSPTAVTSGRREEEAVR